MLNRTVSPASSFSKSAAAPPSNSGSQSASAFGSEMTTVFVGRKRQAFVVNHRLLCAASPLFRDWSQQKMHSSPSSYSPASSSSVSSADGFHTYRPVTLWLPGESATMFGLLVEWLHAPSSIRSYLDNTAVVAKGVKDTQLLHWTLIRLHLFAAQWGLLILQDLAMDAIQDLYLRCDWDVAPSIIVYLYARCDARHAVHLRRWAIAMVAFSLTLASHLSHEQDVAVNHTYQRTASSSSSSASAVCDPARLHSLLDALPEFKADYATHVQSMRDAGFDMRFKNPQLRIPGNALRDKRRVIGFRACTFHSHRSAVRQAPCPHAVSGSRAAEAGSTLGLALP